MKGYTNAYISIQQTLEYKSTGSSCNLRVIAACLNLFIVYQMISMMQEIGSKVTFVDILITIREYRSKDPASFRAVDLDIYQRLSSLKPRVVFKPRAYTHLLAL